MAQIYLIKFRLVLLAIYALGLGNFLHAANTTASILSISQMSDEEVMKFQVETYVQNRGLFKTHVNQSAVIGYNGGYFYTEVFGRDGGKIFADIVRNLRKGDKFIDAGAGQGLALIDYLTEFPGQAEAIGIAYTRPSNLKQLIELEKNNPDFRYFLHDFNSFLANDFVGNISLITDVKGPFRYSLDPAQTLKQMAKMLKSGGYAVIDWGVNIGIKMPDNQDGINFIEYGNDLKSDPRGSYDLFHIWLQTIKGFDIIHVDGSPSSSDFLTKNGFIDNQKHYGTTIILKRNSDPFEIDKLVPDPNRISLNHDNLNHNFTWHMSDRSLKILKKYKDIRLTR